MSADPAGKEPSVSEGNPEPLLESPPLPLACGCGAFHTATLSEESDDLNGAGQEYAR